MSVSTYSFNTEQNKSSEAQIEFEYLSQDEDYPCRWRYCIYYDGEKYCTEWEYGECLEEVIITATSSSISE
ncbi:hypothetical protein [Aureivirga sp. CE67]|uniref:hypothetical protein n=1 Tax=Aureivirga sp. CE67 TaxID=1788983 RepID=UPI001E3C5C3A|nr:hypothetical protein [Aureivirga sp. CE67]